MTTKIPQRTQKTPSEIREWIAMWARVEQVALDLHDDDGFRTAHAHRNAWEARLTAATREIDAEGRSRS